MSVDFNELCAIRISLRDYILDESEIIINLKNKLLVKGFIIENIPVYIKEFYDYINIPISLESINNILNPSNNIFNTLTNNISNNIFNTLTNNISSNNNFNNLLSSILYGNNDNINTYYNNIANYSIYDISNNIIDVSNNIIEEESKEEVEEEVDEEDEGDDVNDNEDILPPLVPYSLYTASYIYSNNVLQYPAPSMNDVTTTLEDTEIEKLKVYNLEEKVEDNCSICMCDLDIGEQVCNLPCNHIFHKECIYPWMQKYNYKCPVCRNEIGDVKYNF
jgi:hypothetical protein